MRLPFTATLEGREKPTPKPPETVMPKRRRRRPRKGEQRPKALCRLTRQAHVTLSGVLDELPHICDVGVKRNAKGRMEYANVNSP